MQSQGMNATQLAAAVGVSSATIGRWQTGEREPTFENLERLAEALDTTVSSLVAGPDELAEMNADQALEILAGLVKKRAKRDS